MIDNKFVTTLMVITRVMRYIAVITWIIKLFWQFLYKLGILWLILGIMIKTRFKRVGMVVSGVKMFIAATTSII